MNKHIIKITNLKEIKKILSQKRKVNRKKKVINRPKAPINKDMMNCATALLKMQFSYSKLFMNPVIKLERLEDSMKFLPKPVNVSIKKLTLKPDIKISRKTAKSCTRNSYVFVWKIHKNCKGMMIRSSVDPNLFIPVEVNMSLN